MPTERFSRLPEEKKAVIRRSAIEEFVRMPYEKVSINQIIYRAGISRGSFYTYFEDKQDVLRYIFEDTRTRIWEFCKKTLEKNSGDIWKTMEELMEYSVTYCESNKLTQFFRNLMLCQEISPLDHGPGGRDEQEMGGWVISHMDKSRFRISDEEEFRAMMTMSMMSIMMAMGEYFRHKEQMSDIRRRFRAQMRLIRYGVEKYNQA